MKQKFTITVADIEINVLSEGSAEEVDAIVNKVDRRIREICLKSPRISKNEAALICCLELCSERDKIAREAGANNGDIDLLRDEYAKAAAKVEKLEAALAEKNEKCTVSESLQSDFELLKEEYKNVAAKAEKFEAKLAAQAEKYETAAAAAKEKFDTATATQKEKYEGRIGIMKEKYEARINSLRARLDDMKKGDSAPVQISLDIDSTADAAEVKPAEVSAAPAEVTPAEAAPAEKAEEKPADTAKGKGKSKVGTMFDLLTFSDV